MIIVDVGCHPQGPEESVHSLIDRFHPEVLFGFDPFPDLEEGVELVQTDEGSTVVVRRRVAAWTHDGEARLHLDGICTGIDNRREILAVSVRCFDLAVWLRTLPVGVVLKLDVEGAEYPILSRIRELDIDMRLARVLVEWHPSETAHGLWITPGARPELRCDVENW